MAGIMDYAIFAVVPFAIAVGYLVVMGRKRDEERAVRESRWIYPTIRISTASPNLERTKNDLRPYAEGLGWAVSESGGQGAERVDLVLAPPKSAMSPKEYAAEQKKIADASFAMLKDLVFGGDEEKARRGMAASKSVDVLGVKEGGVPRRENFYFRQRAGMLLLSYALSNRMRLERGDGALANSIFGATLAADLRSMLGKERVAEAAAEIHENAERLIQGIREKEAQTQDVDEKDKAEIAIGEIRNKEKSLVSDFEKRNEALKRQIERAFDIEIK